MKKDQVEQPGNSTIEEKSDNVSTDDPSFNHMQVHSTSVEDNVNVDIYKDETLKIDQRMLGQYYFVFALLFVVMKILVIKCSNAINFQQAAL